MAQLPSFYNEYYGNSTSTDPGSYNANGVGSGSTGYNPLASPAIVSGAYTPQQLAQNNSNSYASNLLNTTLSNSPTVTPNQPAATNNTTNASNPLAGTGAQTNTASSGWPQWMPQNPYNTGVTSGITNEQGQYIGDVGINPLTQARPETAQALAQHLGGNVYETQYLGGPVSRSGGPELNIDFGSGALLNAGLLAQHWDPNSSFGGITDPAVREYWIRRSIQDELNQSAGELNRPENQVGFDNPMYKQYGGSAYNFLPAGAGQPGFVPQVGEATQGINYNAQPQMPTTSSLAGTSYPTTGTGTSSSNASSGLDLNSLLNFSRLFNMSPNMNSLYYLGAGTNGQLGGTGVTNGNNQISYLPGGNNSLAGLGGFLNAMPFLMNSGGLSGGGLSSMFGSNNNPLLQYLMGNSYQTNPMASSSGNGLMGLLQLLSSLGISF